MMALLALAGPAHAAGDSFEFRNYRVEVTGIQVTDWSYRSSHPPADLTFRRVARRLPRLRADRTLTRHRELRSAGCPLKTDRAGFAACSTTDVTVELTRTS